MNLSITANLTAAALAAALLSSCAAPVSVRTVGAPKGPGLAHGKQDLSVLLDDARAGWSRIAAGDGTAVAGYNSTVARLLERLQGAGADRSGSALEVRAPDGFGLAQARLIPVDRLEFRGEFAKYGSSVPGVGAPVVAVKSLERIGHIQARKDQPLRTLTALVRFGGKSATLELLDPYQTEEITIGARRAPLAADFGAAVMFGLSKARIDKLGLARLLNPGKFADTANLNFLQPYDPARIPVLFVHGLDSTPVTWAPVYFKLLEDDEIRRRYQFWAFSYPSGYPYPYSATLLRRELERVAETFPKSQEMVIIGHSMGSMLSRLMVTDAGETLWKKVFGRPVAETPAMGPSQDLLQECLVFENRPEIRRAVFVSGPHRGADLATNWIGRFGSRLVRAPGKLARASAELASFSVTDTAAKQLGRIPNSIDTLSPENPFVVEVAKLPIAPGVTYHSIIGDRGKGDTPDSSDGVVPYWSSHLEGAASEKIVPSGHSAHHHPEGIEEIRRILLLHLSGAP